jgi:hypothetical protein
MDREKRHLRQLKRQVKKAGSKRRRRELQRDLIDNPAEAHWSQEQLGRYQSKDLNGIDRDPTRRRGDRPGSDS